MFVTSNIFSQSISCLLVLFMVSFAIQKLVHWLGGHLFIFAFISTVWETDPRKHWHALCQRMFCLCSLLGLLWYHVLHFSLFKLFCVNSGDLDSVWSTSWSCRLVWLFNTPVPLGCPHAASPSPLLGCVGWSLSFSPCPLRMSTRVSCAGECSKVARTIWATWFCLPQVGGCTLPWASEAPYLSQLISQPVKGAPRVRELFFFHSSHPGAKVLSQLIPFFFFFFFASFILPGYLVDFLAFLIVWDLSPALSRYSMRTVTHIHVFLMYLWEEMSAVSYSTILISSC